MNFQFQTIGCLPKFCVYVHPDFCLVLIKTWGSCQNLLKFGGYPKSILTRVVAIAILSGLLKDILISQQSQSQFQI